MSKYHYIINHYTQKYCFIIYLNLHNLKHTLYTTITEIELSPVFFTFFAKINMKKELI